MFADHTLTPREAIRLTALGLLAAGPKPYDEVVFAVRHFVSRISGPSLELMGESIELLKYEGLVAGAHPAPTTWQRTDATSGAPPGLHRGPRGQARLLPPHAE